VIELDNLVRFVESPVKAFLRDRLGISVGEFFDEVEDELPVELDALGKWGVGQRLLDGVLAGDELDAGKKAEIARGKLPPGHLAHPVLDEVGAVVAQLAAAAKGLAGDEPPGSLDVNLALPDGRTLAGTVTGVCGDTLRAISYSRLRPRDRLRAWVKLLALSAARPDRPFTSLVIGRARAGAYQADVSVARIAPVGCDALAQLAVLIDLYDRGMREPLPISCDASAAYAQDGVAAADKAWTSTFDYPKEDRQPEHVRAYGGEISLSELLAPGPRDDEDWYPDETSRFGAYARRLWDGLLAREEIADR
jgi:exodeoxyribonuclease V gamma subunit